jgi:DNA-binding SARP family transcriptional activator
MEITIYSLGRFSIVINGNPIQFNLKAQSKPLLVLKALIASGGRDVNKDKISDAIWPDTDGDLASQSLATTLYRLRKILKIDKAITLNGGTMTLNPDICWADVWEFERLCTLSDHMWAGSTNENVSENIKISLQAISLYKGPFLPGEINQTWTFSLRERLRNRYLRTIGKIGHHYERSGMTEKAIESFQRSLEIDQLDEEAYRRLMACYFRIGQRSKALAVYDSCKRVLVDVLGVGPSRETEILRRSILTTDQ